ncbi:MAG: glycine cleavage system aminomethyltransferase GcvT [Acidobacteria bacterium]|nr:glycine cleavage system aminomethyltransferase GcvT [Acidobacteriota bacterium]
MAAPSGPLKPTPLNAVHRATGAKMVDFGGWDMPVQYSGILDEHHAVRRAVGLFDVSHMGEIEIQGPQAFELVNLIATSAVAKLVDGQAQYAGLLYSHGGFVDDILIYRVNPQHYFLCVNASNQDKDYEHIAAQNRFDCTVENAGPRYSQLAIQGPKAAATLQKLTATELAPIKYYRSRDGEVDGVPARMARTGYTGEDCFEVFFAPAESERLWNKIMQAGAEFGIKPCGLGARNTLRLEAGMALYGHEINAEITPIEAGLERNCDMTKEFIGKRICVRQLAEGVTRKLMGFEMTGRGIGRDGYEVNVDGTPAGWVTSGGPSPTLGKNIGLCYLPTAAAQLGRTIQVIVRGQPVDAMTVATPFYKRAR